MTLEEALANARNTFPDFLPEVFTLWLDDRIKKNGWPPSGIEWQGFLLGESIEYWQQLSWDEAQMTLKPSDLGPMSLRIAVQIIEAAQGKNNLISAYISNTRERFQSSLQFVIEHRSLPSKVLLLRGPDGLEVIEGNHRIAALLAVLPQLQAIDSSGPSIQAIVASPNTRNAA